MDISPLLDRLHDAVISTDLEGIVIDCNHAAELIYEYSKLELIGRSVAILYPERELPRMRELIDKVMASGKCDGEFLNRTKSGKEIFIHLSVSLMEDARNEPCGMIGFSIDITKQKKAELAKQEIEALNAAARLAAGVGTWYWDLNCDQFRWDEVSSLLLGLQADHEQSIESFLKCIHPQDRNRVEIILRKCIETGSDYVAEYRVIHQDGSERCISARGSLSFDEHGKPTRMLGVATDVTDRKQAEEKLDRAEAKYRVLFESPIIGVVSATLDCVTDANDAYCKMIGYSREELLSGAVRWQDITPPEYLALDFKALEQLLATGVCTPFEKEYRRKDGMYVRVLIGAALVSREPVAWSCFVLDVTEKQRAVTAMLVGEQLAAAARMGSVLAHEINNPLAALTNALYLMRYGTESMPRDQLLVSAEEALNRVSRITRQMIGIYSEAQRVSDIKVSEVLEDTLAGYSGQIRTKNIRLEKRNEVGDIVYRGVESDLRRMMASLIENAVEHAPAGGKVKVHLYQSREWKRRARGGLNITILDNGPGISRENLPRIFEPFFSTKQGKATGLGLWVSQSLIEKYSGEVRVRSTTRSGRSGTCVAVFLPRVDFDLLKTA